MHLHWGGVRNKQPKFSRFGMFALNATSESPECMGKIQYSSITSVGGIRDFISCNSEIAKKEARKEM